jgi:hypothetical protein
LYAVALAGVYLMMRSSPASFNQFMAGTAPMVMRTIPFVPLWFSARAGTLEAGAAAPDFELRRLHSDGTVKLSSHRGRPVMLVFGSYT